MPSLQKSKKGSEQQKIISVRALPVYSGSFFIARIVVKWFKIPDDIKQNN
jgi:hypothetical protein